MTGFIYAIGCKKLVKIGFSKKPILRLNKINSDAPFRCTLYGMMPGTRDQERQLHAELIAFKVHSEWFRHKGAVAKFVTRLKPPPSRLERAPINSFDAYLILHKLTAGQFADLVKRDRTTVLRWRKGETRPDWEGLEAVYATTGGVVCPNDFLVAQTESLEAAAT
jgi:hypothetical protein